MPDHAEEVADRVDDRQRLATALTALAALRRPEREVIALCLGEDALIKPGTVTFTMAVKNRAVVDGMKQTPSQAG